MLGERTRIFIFGSRADLTKKRGDINILVLSDGEMTEKEKFQANLDISIELYKR